MDATLLLADGDSKSRSAMKRFFSDCGFHVETASTALECLGKVWSLKPEILAVDADLPGGGAAGVTAFLKKKHPGFEPPVLIIIGDAPPESLSRWTGVPRCFCVQNQTEKDRLLDGVGLAAALVDLRRDVAEDHSPSAKQKDTVEETPLAPMPVRGDLAAVAAGLDGESTVHLYCMPGWQN